MIDGEHVRKAICQATQTSHLPEHNADEIETPFVDWKGERVVVWVTRDGLTDAGSTMSEMRALRIWHAFEKWPLREDYLARYGMKFENGAFLAANAEDPESVLRYLQGISKIVGLFEANPIRENPDRFPEKVRRDLAGLLEQRAPEGIRNRRKWAEAYTKPRAWTDLGFHVETDLSPERRDLVFQTLSHATMPKGDQIAHVGYKLYVYTMIQRAFHEAQLVVITPSLEKYPKEARKMIEGENPLRVFDWSDPEEREEAAGLLTARPASQPALPR